MPQQKIIGATLLVSGTTIGAAMLALPTTTGLVGFMPAIGLFALYWTLLAFSAFLILEVTLWMGSEANLVTMARETLGRWGQLLSWSTYLFLLYSLTTAYLAGGSQITRNGIAAISGGYQLPLWAAPLPLLLLFGCFVYRGAHYVDIANRLLMAGMVVCYAAMVAALIPHVDGARLAHVDSRYLLLTSSVVATSFGFHIIIPTLVHYLDHDIAALRRALLVGSLIPLGVYIIWEALTLGVIPLDLIANGFADGADGVHLLNKKIGNGVIAMVAQFFSFFAIVTSLLGVSLSLRDFLADGFQIEKRAMGKLLLYLMTFIPPLVIIWSYPGIFLKALEYAGAFGVMILLVVLPALMVWSGRYRQGRAVGAYRAPGGKGALAGAIILAAGVVALEVAHMVGLTHYFLPP